MRTSATNRQKKVLRFFRVDFHDSISKGAAGWEIGNLLGDPANVERWEKYLFLTKDFGGDTDELLPYSEEQLRTLILPTDWSARREQEELVEHLLHDASPFDTPEPQLTFQGASFCFTGKFDFGSRSECEKAVTVKGARTETGVKGDLDYLVVGTQGNPNWKKGAYGSKIEKAILSRRQVGKPAIVSEQHWVECLNRKVSNNEVHPTS